MEIHAAPEDRGFGLISDALPFGRLWYGKVDDAIGYAQRQRITLAVSEQRNP